MLRELLALPNSSRVWVYQSNREFTYDEMDDIREIVYDFVEAWDSHGMPVQAYGNIFHRRFLVFVADEEGHGVSGCSTDKSVNLVKQLGQKFNAEFFDRWQFLIMREDKEILGFSKDEFAQKYKEGDITEDTLVFDPLVKTKGEFLEKWIIPLQESWHKQFV